MTEIHHKYSFDFLLLTENELLDKQSPLDGVSLEAPFEVIFSAILPLAPYQPKTLTCILKWVQFKNKNYPK